MTDSLGKTLLVIGLLVAVAGLLVMVFGRVPFLGRLPGDIAIERGNWHFYFPLATSLLISIILTVVLNLFFRR